MHSAQTIRVQVFLDMMWMLEKAGLRKSKLGTKLLKFKDAIHKSLLCLICLTTLIANLIPGQTVPCMGCLLRLPKKMSRSWIWWFMIYDDFLVRGWVSTPGSGPSRKRSFLLGKAEKSWSWSSFIRHLHRWSRCCGRKSSEKEAKLHRKSGSNDEGTHS